MKSNEQRTTSSSTQAREPYGQSKPLLDNLIRTSEQVANRPGMFRTTFSNDTRNAFGQFRDIANQSAPAYSAGIDEVTATARGDNLNGNPYYLQALGNSLDRVEDRVNQGFSAAGRYGSGAHTGVLTDRLGEAEVAAMRDNYNFERGNQINAANQGISAGVQGASLLDLVGQRRDEASARNRIAPLVAAQAASGLGVPIANMFGTTSGTNTNVQETPANIPGMVIGGLTAGAGLMTGNPMMAMGGLNSAGTSGGFWG